MPMIADAPNSFFIQNSWRNFSLNTQDGYYYFLLFYTVNIILKRFIISLRKRYTIWVLLGDVGNILQKFMADLHLHKKGNPFKLSSEEKMEVQKIIHPILAETLRKEKL